MPITQSRKVNRHELCIKIIDYETRVSMKYTITLREINNLDINKECPFIPETDEFERYAQAFTEDLQQIPCISNITTHNNKLTITALDTDYDKFKSQVKPLIQNYYQYFRVVMPD